MAEDNLLAHYGPKLARVPLRLTPFLLQQKVMEALLAQIFRDALEEGELDFLAGHHLALQVPDLGIHWHLSVLDGRLVVRQPARQADVVFRANSAELLLVAARKVDPDTLFFQRRLAIEGDTELGLQVKNLIDSLDLGALPPLLSGPLQAVAQRLA
ncbi:SCP2 sterol-binding domain-containing protein [Gallaecimonas sp. GXIMD4217]|uniref:ubiquinone anaerobic biosynthesis accessory factor UbiT n=1 Tax=Gallaecimonas sp. GXIMD4217 TaxID=3131927 RepID=UPI00311AD2C1